MVKEKRILSNYIGWLILGLFICFIGIKNTYASEISQFDFMGKDFNSFWIEQNSSTSGTLSITVSDITQIKPYINIIMASTFEPNFVVTSNNYFTDTWTRKLYSYGTTNVSGHTANVYVIQFSTKGLNNWNCSVDGTNCYVNTNIRMTGPLNYSAVFQLRSISLTDVVLDDDYLKNITVNQNNEIIDQNQTIIDQNQSIISGQDKIEDAIVDSNKETQDVIKDQFNNCSIYNKNIDLSLGSFSSTGNTNSIYRFRTDYIELKNSTYTITLNTDNTNNWQYIYSLFDSNKNVISSSSFINFNKTFNLTIDNSDVKYIRLMFRNNPQTDLSNYLNTTSLNIKSIDKICTNKLDEQNDKLGDLNNSLNDSNVDGSLNNAGSFFDNFSTTDHGGLSGIITAPLVAINQMLNTSCNPMTTNFKGKELSLPCGYDFWNRLGAIQNFINIVLGGMLCYRIIIKLYKLIERIKNPEDDRLEVMDL